MGMKFSQKTVVAGIVLSLVIGGLGVAAVEKNIVSHSRKNGDAMEHLTMATFKEKICDCGLDGHGEVAWQFKGNVPAVIDFYADWCGPCRMVGPILEELSAEYGGKVNFYKINTEQEQELAGSFGITGIPAILFIPVNGKPQMSAGALPKRELQKIIHDALGVDKPAS